MNFRIDVKKNTDLLQLYNKNPNYSFPEFQKQFAHYILQSNRYIYAKINILYNRIWLSKFKQTYSSKINIQVVPRQAGGGSFT